VSELRKCEAFCSSVGVVEEEEEATNWASGALQAEILSYQVQVLHCFDHQLKGIYLGDLSSLCCIWAF